MTECKYCGMFEANVEIINPNFDEDDPTWEVCSDCKDIIREQQKLSFGAALQRMDDKFSRDYGEKVIKEANEKIKEISDKSGIPTLSVTISKKETSPKN